MKDTTLVITRSAIKYIHTIAQSIISPNIHFVGKMNLISLKIFHYSPKAECKIFKAIQNASNPLKRKNKRNVIFHLNVDSFTTGLKVRQLEKFSIVDLSVITI